MNSDTHIAFLGTGLIGAPMAINLCKAGFAVTCYNRTPAKTAPVVEAGATAFGTPAQAAHDADIIITCVTDGPDVEAVLFGENGASGKAKSNALFIDMSTIAPAVAVSTGERLREKGFRFLEAPVTGGTQGAINGTLAILAAGERADFDDALPAFEAMGRNITFCGGPGAGQGVKLCNQIMGALNMLGVAEALVLCGKMGIEGETLVKALDGGELGVAKPGAQNQRGRLRARLHGGHPTKRYALSRPSRRRIGRGATRRGADDAIMARIAGQRRRRRWHSSDV